MTLALRVLSVCAAALAATACGNGNKAASSTAAPVAVSVIRAQAQSVPLTQDLVGRLSPVRSADVRARVAGILHKRVYTEGSDVAQGQPLFEIDPAPLRATLNAQLANLAAAQATYQNSHIAAERARSVAAKGLLSQAALDSAEAAERTAAAAVKQAQANVDSARINLGYANVTAPIAGRAGKQQVTEGALVGQGEATLLTTIDQIDPLYVNFAQAVGIYDEMRRAALSGEVALAAPNTARIVVSLPDGTPYAHAGSVDFSDSAVDAGTGAVTLRGSVPNPDHALLPGMFVNIKLELGALNHAWLVPQRAVQRDAEGAYVMVVGSDDKVARKRIAADRLQGSDWIVTSGLDDGDRIIVSGLQKVTVGTPAAATPWQAQASAATVPAVAPAAR
ncbi:MAG: efflux RND transporter periplasmic adaptor subunit [Dokdonella sp.]|uniref:efflux RND transporter periplasmic adaptor subunit n=1 Tax=Dokdonella sp. TaxID=2291710 RepID=UPI0025BB3190|nr:efflux RND transporter periplasmic adaptor subunit [Dokdonella sp.]MBX3700609.1 efflux RND transporter periplasmic adaptor subunit [Dokdonella sp.]